MSDSDKQKFISLRLQDGTEVTVRTRGDSRQRTVEDVLATMGEIERRSLQGLAEAATAASMIDLPEPSAADAMATFGELPDPRDVPVAETISDLPEPSIPYTPQESNTSACPWCGHPITLSRTPGAGS